jgi:hypothetical protein
MLLGVLLVIGILSFLLFRWLFKIESKYIDTINDDEPFELTEMSKLSPTPTPVIGEKKKRVRKTKNSN